MNFLINNQKRYNVFLSALTPRKSSALETIAMVNRHGLMLLWLKDLINVTEKLQFIDSTILLYTQK